MLWHFSPVMMVCKTGISMGFSSQGESFGKERRCWHSEVRLKFTEVAGDGGGILMGTDTHVSQQAVLQDTSAQLSTAL